MTSLTRRAFLSVGAVTGLLALTGCTLQRERPHLVMACGEQGGTYVQFGELLAGALARGSIADLEARATRGSFHNLELLSNGTAQLGIALADAALREPRELVAIGRVYQNYLQCVVAADSTITSLDELAGHRVCLGAPGSGASYTATQVLTAAGLLDGSGGGGEIDSVELGIHEAAAALAAGEVDAMFWSSGIPAPVVAHLAETTEIRLIALGEVLPTLEDAHPGVYLATALPAGSYGNAADVPTVGTANYLLARPDLPDEIASGLVDVLIGESQRLVPEGSVGVQYLTAANLIDTVPIQLHPAAVSRYQHHYG